MNVFTVNLKGEMALFKKNDANDIVHISYNFIHKPVILGILGAIVGYSGYAKSGENKMPEYYEKLKKLKISILPHYKDPLKKVINYFNNATGLASKEKGGIWQIKEQVLIGNPEIKYTIFILNDNTREANSIKYNLENGHSEYPIYFGKNEFFAHYEDYKEYEATPMQKGEYEIQSLVRKGENDEFVKFKNFTFDDFDPFDINTNTGNTIYEYLPYDFDENGFYKKDLFVFTENKLLVNNPENFYNLKDKSKSGRSFNVQFI